LGALSALPLGFTLSPAFGADSLLSGHPAAYPSPSGSADAVVPGSAVGEFPSFSDSFSQFPVPDSLSADVNADFVDSLFDDRIPTMFESFGVDIPADTPPGALPETVVRARALASRSSFQRSLCSAGAFAYVQSEFERAGFVPAFCRAIGSLLHSSGCGAVVSADVFYSVIRDCILLELAHGTGGTKFNSDQWDLLSRWVGYRLHPRILDREAGHIAAAFCTLLFLTRTYTLRGRLGRCLHSAASHCPASLGIGVIRPVLGHLFAYFCLTPSALSLLCNGDFSNPRVLTILHPSSGEVAPNLTAAAIAALHTLCQSAVRLGRPLASLSCFGAAPDVDRCLSAGLRMMFPDSATFSTIDLHQPDTFEAIASLIASELKDAEASWSSSPPPSVQHDGPFSGPGYSPPPSIESDDPFDVPGYSSPPIEANDPPGVFAAFSSPEPDAPFDVPDYSSPPIEANDPPGVSAAFSSPEPDAPLSVPGSSFSRINAGDSSSISVSSPALTETGAPPSIAGPSPTDPDDPSNISVPVPLSPVEEEEEEEEEAKELGDANAGESQSFLGTTGGQDEEEDATDPLPDDANADEPQTLFPSVDSQSDSDPAASSPLPEDDDDE
jgi:hypothetical protein